MRKLLLSTMFLSVITWQANAQISQGGTPPSIKYNIGTDVDRIVLHPRDMKFVMNEEEKLSKDGYLPHIGYSLNTDISMDNSGTWTDLPEGGRIWQVQIKSPSALAQVVYYDKFKLPVGSKLFLYNEDKTQVLGAYTWYNNDPSGYFANELVYGDIVNIEYYEPSKVIGKADFHINEVGYIYRGVSVRKNTNWTEPSASCEINVKCSPVGDNWQDEKQGVARILVTTPSGQGWCSGSLVNNTNQNCTPYFLTAWHCYENATASQLNQWIFYFNYESSSCTTPTTEPSSNSMTGASLKAAASITGGSDFILLQLNQTVPTSYNPYMNGWDRSSTSPSNGVGIHHPAASIKKISTYASATSATYTGSAANAHWKVIWTSNSNGWGVTEGGSSGSPLFNSAGNIVGTLTGGSSYCTAQSSPDYYGKVYYHWDQNSGGTTTQLKTWLDPTSSGVTSLTGKNCGSTSGPTAAFTGTPTTVIVHNTVTFTSQSTGTITSYSWSFPGGTPSSSTSAGPVTVTYNTVGVYNVSLTVGTPSNTMTKTNYINVVNQGTSVCDTMHYPLAGTATLYGVQTGGYVSGNNSYGDLAKADYFTGATSGWTISDVYIYFAIGKGGTVQVPVKIWNDNGTGNTPSTVLGTVNVPLATIVTNVTAQAPTLAHFSAPVSIDGTFFVGVVLPTVTGDTVAIVTNTDGDTNPGTAWEQGSNSAWASYSSDWNINVQHAIWPILCNPTNVSTSAANNHVSMYPNPANDKLNLYFGDYTGDVVITISNVLGKELIKTKVKVTSSASYIMNISSLKSGVYLINGVYGEKSFTDKLQIIK
jgi:PKD repeat protein